MIRQYGYKPLEWEKQYTAPRETKRYFGFELEVSAGHSGINSATLERGNLERMTTNIFENADIRTFTVNDSSVGYGYETVTHPNTISYWNDKKLALDEVFNELLEYGYNDPYNLCGMHLHVSKRNLGKTKDKQFDMIDKIMVWFADNKKDLFKLSGRTKASFDQWTKIEPSTPRAGLYDRYNAINARNKYTLELRMFTGAKCTNDIIGAMQFFDAVISLAKSRHLKLEEFTVTDLVNWKKTNKELKTIWQERRD